MNQTQTAPGKYFPIPDTEVRTPEAERHTVSTTALLTTADRSLFSQKLLRRAQQHEDNDDIEAARIALDDPSERVSYKDVRKELGLD